MNGHRYPNPTPAIDAGDCIGFRPESLNIDGGGEGFIEFDGSVALVETFGDYCWYYLDSDINSEVVVKSADDGVMESVKEGDRVTVGVRPDDIHLFDPASGEAIR